MSFDPKYEILTSEDREELEKHVSEALTRGAKPVGGVSVTTYQYTDRDGDTDRVFVYTQAVAYHL